ncbi:MAG: YkgJ family cysteine cluster protein [Candidatus Omnitrophota bacterium]
MADLSKLRLDIKNFRILFSGNCEEVRDICRAMCCRLGWIVPLSPEEHSSGKYKNRAVCSVNGNDCEDPAKECINRKYLIMKKKNGACVYLNKAYRCSIYDERPAVCRDFSCSEGWSISTPYAYVTPKMTANKKERVRSFFAGDLSGGMKFIRNPAMDLKTFFCVKDKNSIVFVKRPAGSCRFFPVKCGFSYEYFDEPGIRCLISAFNGINTLNDIHSQLNTLHQSDIPDSDFYEAVGLLYSQGIVIYENNGKNRTGQV